MSIPIDNSPISPPGPRLLTKSEFVAGRQCHKRLWWTVHEPHCQELVPDRNALAIMANGRLVGHTARDHLPGGILIGPAYLGSGERVEETRHFMTTGAPVIYEATFAAEGCVVSTDILLRDGDGWTLIEVKSSLDTKDEQVADVAFQAWVARASGAPVRRVEVMHLNRECRHPELDALFTRDDVTEAAAAREAAIAAEAREQLTMLSGIEPAKEIGPHCEDPQECPFKRRCWPTWPEHHVSTMYYAKKAWWDWAAKGWHTIPDLPADVKLRGGAPAKRQARCIRDGKTMIVEDGLRGVLDAWPRPLAFLDFETVQLPIPAWPGCSPLMQVPVQFSCDVEDASAPNGLLHYDFLAEGPEDPRPELARRLAEACRGAGAVVAYYHQFEKKCLQELAAAVPELEGELLGIASRLVDLLPVVRDHVYHPAFGGGFGLKKVLPALVAGTHYDELEIAEGATASHELERLMFHRDAMAAQEWAFLRDHLLEYCRMDTWGMVRLFRQLEQLQT
jgi:hypothetical protein